MKEYLAKKYIFSVAFIVVVYVLAISNFIFSYDELEKSVKNSVEEAEITDIDSAFETANEFVSSLNNTMNENVQGKYNYVELYGLYNKVLGKNEYNGFDIVKDNNGYLLYGNLWNFNLDDNTNTEVFAQRVYNMQQKLEGTDTKLYVVGTPVKSMEEYLDFETGIAYLDYNDTLDSYLYYCSVLNLRTVDLRTAMKKSGLDYEQMFFKTDHHWTPQAAFYGYKYLVETLKKDGYDLDPTGKYTSIDNYNLETYENCWLGTFGINTGVNYLDEMESITILTPKFETEFVYQYKYPSSIYTNEITGSFDGTLLQRKYIYEQVENDLYQGSAYSVYLNGVCEYDHIENKNNPDGPKVLFIRDSYSSPLGSYIANLCSEVDMVWAKEYGEKVEELIENNDYDFIFVVTWPENLLDESFEFYIED